MEKIDELLDKYFNGETTLLQEKALKDYFSSVNVAAEHEPYRAMFRAFGDEANEKAVEAPIKREIPKKASAKRFLLRSLAYSGVAATFLMLLWVQRPLPNGDYAVVSGRRIEDSEYAQKYAEKKLEKVNQMLRNSMKPMRSFETVRKSLEPVLKIEQTKQRIDELQNKADK